MKNRVKSISVITVLMIFAIIFRLFSLQIIHGEDYKKMSVERVTTTTIDSAKRGEILDRYGKPLITNRVGYSLKIQKTGMKSDEFNNMTNELLHILSEYGFEYQDTLPISEYPYKYTFVDENGNNSEADEMEEWFSKRKKLTPDMTPDESMDYYKKNVYNIDNKYTEAEARDIIGFRFDLDTNGFSATTPYTVVEDVDINIVTIIKERQLDFPGVYVSREYYREYEYEKLAAHILGCIGKMNRKEYEDLKEKGYGYSALIGKMGIEKLEEENLRGVDGKKNVMQDLGEDSEITLEDIPSIPGNYVTLTIDADLQEATEKSLENRISDFASRGLGANAGAAVVLDIKNGDVLALANYPTYNPKTYNKDYQELVKDKAKPLWNRAISGTYTPGSTLKPLVAIAALESGTVTTTETIECNGIYDFFGDYKPKCWIWSSKHETHGKLDVSGAIANSCNCYFYEAGRRCGIDVMNNYARMYGLDELTGIELPEETAGKMSNPERKKQLTTDGDDEMWYPGDVIQSAIGQSYSAFTPIQLANYISAIANGGTLYKTHIIKNVRSSQSGEIIKESTPEILNKISVSEKTLTAVKKGMFGVADEGSASVVFKDYPVNIGGKTGTAQVGKNKSDNALFVAFAPFEKPEIAVAIVIEKGNTGANAAYVARDIFDEYFRTGENNEKYEIIGELLP